MSLAMGPGADPPDGLVAALPERTGGDNGIADSTVVSQRSTLRIGADAPFDTLVGVGGIGTGILLALDGDHPLGRSESRSSRLLDARDYCKLHIVAHYVAVLLGADPSGRPFRVVPVGKVGDDEAGQRLLDEMAAVGMETSHVDRVSGRPTLFSVCFQYPDGAGGNITTADSAAAALQEDDVDYVEPLLAAGAGRSIVVAVPEVPLDVRRRLLELGTAHSAFRAAAFTSSELRAVRASNMLDLLDLLSMNEDEAASLSDVEFDAADPGHCLDRCASVLAARQRDLRILVSAGRHGAFAMDSGRWGHCPALSVGVASTAGAGDALLAGVLAGIAAGLPLVEPGPPRREIGDRPLSSALDLGVLLAGYSVTSPHTIHQSATVDTLTTLAADLGLTFGGRLARLVGVAARTLEPEGGR
jgi:sugar/nucleoside kinase (ribokinase family)